MLRDATLSTWHPALRHGFFTRHGGVSEGHYASLNCGLGSGDDPQAVAANRARAMAALDLPAAALVTAAQVHSARVIKVEAPWPDASRPQADALVTRRQGVALGILTADCAPVLFADAGAGVVGAAHAGWRGAKAGVLESTVAAMTQLGARAERIAAAVGPCIRQASYEVGADFQQAFVGDDRGSADLFAPAARPAHFRFDLAGFVTRRLQSLGLASVAVQPYDTFADEATFFSYRRVTLNGGGDYGRMLAAIALAG
jgi:polyphenol oxidase